MDICSYNELDHNHIYFLWPLIGSFAYGLQKADQEFAISLASLVHNIRVAGEMHADFVGGMQNPAEILTGCFTGIQVIKSF